MVRHFFMKVWWPEACSGCWRKWMSEGDPTGSGLRQGYGGWATVIRRALTYKTRTRRERVWLNWKLRTKNIENKRQMCFEIRKKNWTVEVDKNDWIWLKINLKTNIWMIWLVFYTLILQVSCLVDFFYYTMCNMCHVIILHCFLLYPFLNLRFVVSIFSYSCLPSRNVALCTISN